MNKHSIIRLITLFFVFIFLLINGLFYKVHTHFDKKQEMEQIRRFLIADRLLHEHTQDFSVELKQLMIRPVQLSKMNILSHGRTLLEFPFGKIVEFNTHTYFLKDSPPKPPMDFNNLGFVPPPHENEEFFRTHVLEDIQPHSLMMFWMILMSIDILIISFFIYILKKLLPLHHLKNAIIAFQDGDKKLNISIQGYDEIAQITEEFNSTLEKIASMREARSLFLRNILHELKTPIMKGSLTAENLEASDDQERLKRIFLRMDYLLNEFAKMENFSSGEWHLKRGEYRFVDLLDHSCDMLLCDKESLTIEGKESELILHVDFELFTIALKNLLDNAIKYSTCKPTVTIKNNAIVICNDGEVLAKEKQIFEKPFNREYENSAAGLGLGLYISNSILKKHNFRLLYTYQNGYNCFKIETL